MSEKNLVEELRYAANDEVRAWVAALEIKVNKETKFVLHRFQSCDGGIYEKIEYSNEESLLNAFPYGIGTRKGWEETNSTCGYDIPKQEFLKARSRRLDKILNS